jgi:hypothetical protein
VLGLSGPTGDLFLLALVVTGADEKIIPFSAAEEIGVELDEEQRSHAGGISGSHLELVAGRVELEIIGSDESFQWPGLISFAKFENVGDECAILGRIGGLEFFTATFDGNQRQGTLVPNDSFPGTVDSG